MLNLQAIKEKAEAGDWVEHPFTRYLARAVNTDIRKARLRAVLAKCRISNDGDVRAAVTEYDAMEELHLFLSKLKPTDELEEENGK